MALLMIQPALFPMGEYAQRWENRRDSFRHKSELAGFNPLEYDVDWIRDYSEGVRFIEENHYSGSVPPIKWLFGFYHYEKLVGVAALTIPTNEKTLTNIFPDLIPLEESIELGRFVLLDEVPYPAESYFWARVRERLEWDGIRGIVSFSDPMSYKDHTGRIISPGHYGCIYQASNGIYLGLHGKRKIWVLPTGRTLHERMLSKIRKQERGRVYATDFLIEAGARPPGSRVDWATWVSDALIDIGAEQIRHPGKHKYVFLQGSRRIVKILEKSLPVSYAYPKRLD